MSFLFSKKQGFSLIETLVALAILSAVLVGPLSIAQTSIASARLARDQTAAFYLAAEAIEFVRNVRDTNHLRGLNQPANWLSDLSACMMDAGCVIDSPNNAVYFGNYCGGTSCPLLSQNGLYGYVSGWTPSNFTREVHITSVGSHEASVVATVRWKSGGLPERVIAIKETILNWQP